MSNHITKRWVLQCLILVVILLIIFCVLHTVKNVSETFNFMISQSNLAISQSNLAISRNSNPDNSDLMISMKSLNNVPGYGFGSYRFQEPVPAQVPPSQPLGPPNQCTQSIPNSVGEES